MRCAERLAHRQPRALHARADPALRHRPGCTVGAPRHGRCAMDEGELAGLVAAEIREPTTAMASSFRALEPEHRALLDRDARRPAGAGSRARPDGGRAPPLGAGFAQQPSALLDRLSDHFVARLAERDGHVGASELARPRHRPARLDASAATRFLRACSVDGLLLALSTGGGGAGTRSLPLLVEDGDWDARRSGSPRLVPGARRAVDDATAHLARRGGGQKRETRTDELEALAWYALERLARRWNERHEPIPVGLLGRWLELRTLVPKPLRLPDLAPTWIEHLPSTTAEVRPPRSSRGAPRVADARGAPARARACGARRVRLSRAASPARVAVPRPRGRAPGRAAGPSTRSCSRSTRIAADDARARRACARRARSSSAQDIAAAPQETYVPRPLPRRGPAAARAAAARRPVGRAARRSRVARPLND